LFQKSTNLDMEFVGLSVFRKLPAVPEVPKSLSDEQNGSFHVIPKKGRQCVTREKVEDFSAGRKAEEKDGNE